MHDLAALRLDPYVHAERFEQFGRPGAGRHDHGVRADDLAVDPHAAHRAVGPVGDERCRALDDPGAVSRRRPAHRVPHQAAVEACRAGDVHGGALVPERREELAGPARVDQLHVARQREVAARSDTRRSTSSASSSVVSRSEPTFRYPRSVSPSAARAARSSS